MALTTTQRVVELAGIGVKVVDENVGTGDNSETDYDLDNDNVIAGTYTLSHAASGSNSFTAMTETTHYTLDKQSGRIVLTSGGVTELGTDILYAKYVHVEDLQDDEVSQFITFSDAEVEKVTGRIWEDQSITEYHDGPILLDYPHTDEPYSADIEEYPFVMMENYPVRYLEEIYFLKRGAALSQVWSYDDSGTSYTDNTTNANTAGESDFNVFAATPASGDIIYVGASFQFLSLYFNLVTVGTGSPTIVWEYYNGSSWATITTTDEVSGAAALTASGRFSWSALASWTKNSVNSSSDYYYVRGRVTAGYTVAPVAREIFVGQDDAIDSAVSLRDVDISTEGRLTFVKKDPPYGTRNIRVKARVGFTSSNIPTVVQELSALYAALRCFSALTGGSFDDETSFSLGSKTVTVGEVYVNVAEVVRQFQKRISQIKAAIGVRANVFAT